MPRLSPHLADHVTVITELGHLELHGHDAETRASSKVKEDEKLSWQRWAHRVQKYLAHVEMLFAPDLFVIGGGVSRESDRFLPLIEGIRAEIVPAQLLNNAGIVGAAMTASRAADPPKTSNPQKPPKPSPSSKPSKASS